MISTLEQVARSIAMADGIGFAYVNRHWRRYMPGARSALYAIQTPTAEMLEVLGTMMPTEYVLPFAERHAGMLDVILRRPPPIPAPSPEDMARSMAEIEDVLRGVQTLGRRI